MVGSIGILIVMVQPFLYGLWVVLEYEMADSPTINTFTSPEVSFLTPSKNFEKFHRKRIIAVWIRNLAWYSEWQTTSSRISLMSYRHPQFVKSTQSGALPFNSLLLPIQIPTSHCTIYGKQFSLSIICSSSPKLAINIKYYNFAPIDLRLSLTTTNQYRKLSCTSAALNYYIPSISLLSATIARIHI